MKKLKKDTQAKVEVDWDNMFKDLGMADHVQT